MDTRALEKIVPTVLACADDEASEQFTGVFPIDHLPNAKLFSKGKLRMCIINSHTSTQPGEHWLVVGIDMRNPSPEQYHAFIFDSLSRNLKQSYPILYNFLGSNALTLRFILTNKTN